MAWIESRKKVVNSQTIKIYSGKIDGDNGSIVSDNGYYYSDYIPCPDGKIYFCLGEEQNINYIGLMMYKEDNTYITYWGASDVRREVNCSSYYSSGARYIRMSFRKSAISVGTRFIFVLDEVNEKLYTLVNPIQLVE